MFQHNPKNPKVFQMIKNNFSILEANPNMKKVLEEPKSSKVNDKVLHLPVPFYQWY